jgi:hypothetical protein
LKVFIVYIDRLKSRAADSPPAGVWWKGSKALVTPFSSEKNKKEFQIIW